MFFFKSTFPQKRSGKMCIKEINITADFTSNLPKNKKIQQKNTKNLLKRTTLLSFFNDAHLVQL